MITPELQTYICQQLGAGIAKDVIKQNLSTQGWNAQDLDEAFLSIENVQFAHTIIPSPQLVNSGGHKGKLAIIIVVLLFISAGGAYAAYHYGLFNKLLTSTTAQLPVAATTESPAPITNTESTNTTIPVSGTTTSTTTSTKTITQLSATNPASCLSEKLVGNIIIQGKVIFPKGISQRDYTTTTGESLDSNNSFCTQGSKGRLFNLLLLSNTENALVIGAAVYSQNDISNLIIDSKSIATIYVIQALVLPIGSANMTKIPNFIQEVSDNPAVIAFANGIATANNLTFADIDTGGLLEKLYKDAIKTTLESLSAKYLSH